MTVGFGESHIYFGLGNGNIAALKSAITSSDKDGVDVDPLSGYLSVGSFIGFFADKLDNPDVKLLAEAIGRGNDKILMTMTSERHRNLLRHRWESRTSNTFLVMSSR